MADCWRSSDYDWNRRASHPNRTWRRSPSQPRHPLGPARSNTMDSSRDPRRKRNQSRSPEGGQLRKQFKAGQTSDGAAAQTNSNGTRASSASNGTPTHQFGGVLSSTQRRMSTQSSKEAGKEGSSLFVDSPERSASINGDNSGRSTPQRQGRGVQHSERKTASAEASTDVAMKDLDTTADSTSILNLLTNFGSLVAVQASLQIARDQAEERANRLRREYNANYPRFPEFPAIKERKTADKAAAQKDLAAKEHKLSEHKASQKKTMTNLAKIIGQANEAQSRTDIVSRADYDRLAAACETFQAQFGTLRSSIENLSTQVTELKVKAEQAQKVSGQVSVFQGKIERLQNDAKAVQTLEDDYKHIHRQIEQVRDSVKDAKAAHATTFATKDALRELETQYEKLAQDVAGVKKSNGELQLEVRRVAATQIAAKVAPAQPTSDLASDISDTFKQKVQKVAEPLIERFEELETKITSLEKGMGDLKDDMANLDDYTRGENGGDADKSLSQKFDKGYEHLQQTRNSIESMMDAVQEQGKEPLVKRVKNLDQIVNNLSSRIETIQPDGKTSIQQRLSQLELDQAAVEKDLQSQSILEERLKTIESECSSIKTSAQMNSQGEATSKVPTSLSVDLGPLRARLDQVERELRRQVDDAKERDQIIDKHIGQEIGLVLDHVRELNKHRLEDLEKLSTSLETLQNNLVEINKSVDGKVSQELYNAFGGIVSGTFQRINDDITGIKASQAQQQKSRAISDTAAPPPNGYSSHLMGPHMSNGVARSPQMSNGVDSSPLLTAPPPRRSSPHGSALAPPPPNQAPDVKIMQQQVDGLVKVTNALQSQYNNLQTDEIVHRMVGQYNLMYPHAKNFEHAIKESRNKEIALANVVSKLQADVTMTSSDLKNLEKEMKGVSTTAVAAEKLSKHSASRLDDVKVEEAKDAFDKLYAQVNTLERKATTLEERVLETVATCAAGVTVLEDKVKDLEKRSNPQTENQ